MTPATRSVLILIALSGALLAGLNALAGADATSDLRVRADRIFGYDHSYPGRLPAHRVRALSVAMAFKDSTGAQVLLRELEFRRIHRTP